MKKAQIEKILILLIGIMIGQTITTIIHAIAK